MKRFVSVVLAAVIALCASGCSTEIDTEKNILKYAKEHFSNAEHVRTETTEKSRRCYFIDIEYGFEFYVSSSVNSVGMDGATFWMNEEKGSNFEAAYYAYMRLQCGIDGGAVMADGTEIVPLEFVYDDGISIDVIAADGGTQAACTHAEALRNSLKALDTRGYWNNISCTVFDENGERYLTYDILHEQPLTPADEQVIYYTEMARMLNSEAEFVRTETGIFADTGFVQDDLPNILGSEKPAADTVVTYYYFIADGKEFFLADFNAFEGDDHQRFFWYNNYSKVFGE